MEQRILPSRIYVEIEEVGGKFKKAVTAFLKELGFTEEEVSELVIVINRPEDGHDGMTSGQERGA